MCATKTGIGGDAKLVQLFTKSRQSSSSLRVIKVSISNEKFIADSTFKTVSGAKKSTWISDLKSHKIPSSCVESEVPCFMLVKLDPVSEDRWLFVFWSPDTAPVRLKMLYASSKSELKTSFGEGRITRELCVNCLEELNVEAFEDSLREDFNLDVLSESEKQMAEVEKMTSGMEVSYGLDKNSSIEFPLASKKCEEIVSKFHDGNVNYIQFTINVAEETIEVEESMTVDVISSEKTLSKVLSVVPEDKPSYHLIRMSVPVSDTQQHANKVVFLHTIPDESGLYPSGKQSIKTKMLYSTCKYGFLNLLDQNFDLKVDKKVEVDLSDKITYEWLCDMMKSLDNDGMGGRRGGGPIPFQRPAPSRARRLIKPIQQSH